MKEIAVAGDWVEIHRVVWQANERLTTIPEDTKEVPLEMRVVGFLQNETASIGETVKVKTPVGRIWQGTLKAINPAPNYKFGPPVPELKDLGVNLRAILKNSSGEGDQ